MAKGVPRLDKHGPFLGMRYGWRQPRDEQYAYLALNMLPQVRNAPSPYQAMTWPERTTLGSALEVQALNVLIAVASKNVGVFDGELYDESGGSWTRRVTTANLTTAGITLAGDGRVFTVQFGSVMVISDGVNTPFTWDGSAGAGGLVKLTNAPVFYGRPTVYYGKLFAIKNTERDTIVWSEENQPNTGYEAGGFNNAWSLTQTGGGSLYALLGTNEALYYWRANRVGAIRGAVTPDFTASGTHDDVGTEGTTDTEAVCYVGGLVWFADTMGRPHYIEGGRAVDAWDDVADAFPSVVGDTSMATGGQAGGPTPREVVAVPHENIVVFHWPAKGMVIYDTVTRRALGIWTPPGSLFMDFSAVPGDVTPARLGQQISANLLAVGIGYKSDVGGLARVDRWPPFSSTDVYDSWQDDFTGAALPALVLPPVGGETRGITEWTRVDVLATTGKGGAEPVFLAVAVNQGDLIDPQDAAIGVPENLTLVTLSGGQEVVVGETDRRQQRCDFGLLRRSRLCMAAVIFQASGPNAVGVERVEVSGLTFPADPDMS